MSLVSKIIRNEVLQGFKLIGANKKGIKVFRKTLADGTVVTKSFKNGKAFKTITQNKGQRQLYLANNNLSARKSYTQNSGLLNENFKNTFVENHETGKKMLVRTSQNGYHIENGIVVPDKKNWYRADYNPSKGIALKERTISTGFDGKITDSKTISQTNGGSLTHVYKENGNQTTITANNFTMPNGQIVNGEYGNSLNYPKGLFNTNVYQTANGIHQGNRIAYTSNPANYEVLIPKTGNHFNQYV